MAIQSASAALTSTSQMIPITGFIPYSDGVIDPISNTVKALGVSTWGSLAGTGWGQFTNYIQTFTLLRWTAPRVDLGAVQYFTLNIEAQFVGTLSYLIHVSETGLFQGEEREYYIQDGDLDVPGFYGRYCYVTAVLNGTELEQILITADTSSRTYQIVDVVSSTLAGTITNRIIPLPTPVSQIKDIHIEVRAATTYPVNLYVSDTPTSQVLIPVVTSKSNTQPAFALFGIDNDARNGTVDITITALPRQAMFNGSLVVLA